MGSVIREIPSRFGLGLIRGATTHSDTGKAVPGSARRAEARCPMGNENNGSRTGLARHCAPLLGTARQGKGRNAA